MPYYWDDAQKISLPVPAGGMPGGGYGGGGGLFGGLMGGGQPQYGGLIGAAGGASGNTDALMEALLRRQLQQAMQPDWGRMAAAFAEAGMPSRVPIPFGVALGKAAGAMSGGEGGDLKAMQMLKLMQDIQTSRGEQELRRQIGGQIGKVGEAAQRYMGGGPGTGGGATGNVVPGGALTGSRGGPQPGEMMAFATAIGASPNEAALLTSAAGAESSYNPTATHDGGIGYGLFGHNGSRLAAMRGQYGDAPSWQDQVRFALAELRSRPEGKTIDSLTTPEDLTEAQMQFERPNRKINDGNFAGRLALTRQFMGAPVPQTDPNRLAGSDIDLPEVPRYGSDLRASPSASRGLLAAAAPSPVMAAPGAPAAPGESPGPTAAPTQKQQYDAELAAGRRTTLPFGTKFNSRGEAISPDLRATLEGQQRGAPNLNPSMGKGWRDVGPGNVWYPPESGGGIPALIADEGAGGGGDDGGGLVAGGKLGGGASPVPGIFGPQAAAPAQPPVPGVFAPPAAAAPAPPAAPPPAAAPYTPPTLPNIPMATPRPPPAPDTRETQAMMAQIATLRAQTIAAKLGDPFGPMADMIQNSPRFKAEQAAIQKSIEFPYEMEALRMKTEEAIRQGRVLQPLEIEKITKQGEQQRETDLAKMGIFRNPKSGQFEFDPNWLDAKEKAESRVEGAKEKAKQQQQLVDVTINGEKFKVTVEEQGIWSQGGGIPRLGVPPDPTKAAPGGAPGSGAAAGPRGGTPEYTEAEKGIQKYVAENFGTQHKAALDAASSISQVHDARRLIEKGIFAGKTGPLDLEIARIGTALGVTGADTKEKVANTQTFLIQRSRDTLNLIRALGANPSNTDRIFAEKIAGGDISLDPQTLRDVLNTQERLNREVIRRFNELASGPNVVRATGGKPMTVEAPGVYKGRTGKGQDGSNWYTDETGQWVQEK